VAAFRDRDLAGHAADRREHRATGRGRRKALTGCPSGIVLIPDRALKRRKSAPYTAENRTRLELPWPMIWSIGAATPPRPSARWRSFEESRNKCPMAHSNEHEGFYLLLNYADVRCAMGDYKTYSSSPRCCVQCCRASPSRLSRWTHRDTKPGESCLTGRLHRGQPRGWIIRSRRHQSSH